MLAKTICFPIFIAITATFALLTGSETIEGSAADYDEKFSKFLEEILENFREEMPTGIPEIGIPPVDPLVIPNINEDVNDGVARLTLRMRNLTISGISRFRIDYLRADLERGFLNGSLRISSLRASGFCYMDGKILGIFPLNSNGDFFIEAKEVHAEVHGTLNVTRGEKVKIHMNTLVLNLTFDKVDVQFSSLLGGGKWTQTLIKLLTGLGRTLFMHFHGEAMSELAKILLKVINKELDKGTLSEFIKDIPLFYSMHGEKGENIFPSLRRYYNKHPPNVA